MPVTYASPGVYVEEIERGVKPIEAVGVSTAAFVGITAEASLKAIDAATGEKLVVECTPAREAHFASRSFGAWSDYAPPGELKDRFELDLVAKRSRYSTYLRAEVIDERGWAAWTNPIYVLD